MAGKYFIDSHCHFFNLDDIPIFTTLKALLPVKSILAFGSTIQNVAQDALDEFKPSIMFFENSRGRNLEKYSAQIWKDIGKKGNYDGVILTPLIMDFSRILDSQEKLYEQAERLLNAIKEKQVELSLNKTKILPFIGFDLRHLDDCNNASQISDKMLSVSKNFFSISEYEPPDDIQSIGNGTILGIKLYPPIGFSPYPEDDSIQSRYSKFFDLCSKKQIPITTHCQSFNSGSYRPGDVSEKKVDVYTNPDNWKRVLKEHKSLKINFAHFGGEIIFRNTFFKTSQLYACEPKQGTWVWKIVELLKKYPNTFSDISAFDFKKQACTDAFGVMMILDETGLLDQYIETDDEINQLFPLKDKILWGSDFPMVIQDWKDNYLSMFNAFKEMLNLESAAINLQNSSQYSDVDMRVPDQESLIERFVSINPEKFLFK